MTPATAVAVSEVPNSTAPHPPGPTRAQREKRFRTQKRQQQNENKHISRRKHARRRRGKHGGQGGGESRHCARVRETRRVRMMGSKSSPNAQPAHQGYLGRAFVECRRTANGGRVFIFQPRRRANSRYSCPTGARRRSSLARASSSRPTARTPSFRCSSRPSICSCVIFSSNRFPSTNVTRAPMRVLHEWLLGYQRYKSPRPACICHLSLM